MTSTTHNHTAAILDKYSQPNHLQGMKYLLALWQQSCARLTHQGLLRNYPAQANLEDFNTTKSSSSFSSPSSSNPLSKLPDFDTQARRLADKLLNHRDLADPYNLNTNDYLGLQRSWITRGIDAKLANHLPIGGLSSRLVGTHHPIYAAVEHTFAQITGFERALYFSSGMTLNLALPAFFNQLEQPMRDQSPSRLNLISDALNHASTIQGMKYQSTIPKVIFEHLAWHSDTMHQTLNNPASWCDLIFTEGLYSMRGDAPSGDDINSVMRTAPSAVLVLDEAHSFGTHLQGCFMNHLTTANPQLTQYTLGVYPMGKAMGCGGAFLTGRSELMAAVWNLCKPFIYTTAPSPLMAGALLLRLKMHTYLHNLRQRLAQISHELARQLKPLDYPIYGAGSPFLIIVIGSSPHSLRLAHDLQTRGIQTTAMRYPTVPHHQSCLRLSLHPFLRKHHLDTIVKALYQAVHGTAKS